MKYLSVYISLIGSFFWISLEAQTHLNNFHHLSVEDGLPNDWVYDILQDERGYMWFATGSGLCRYDGYSFRNFTVNDGMLKNDVRNIFQDSEGKIWVLPTGSVSVAKNGVFYGQKTLRFLGDDRKFSILEDSARQIWFSSRNLTYLPPDGNAGKIQSRRLGLVGTPILQFVDQTGGIWVSDRRGLTIIKDKKVWKKIPSNYPANDPDFQLAICYLKDHSIIHNTTDGIVFLDTTGNPTIAYKNTLPDFNMSEVSHILEDKQGGIWVAGESSGALRLERKNGGIILRDHVLKDIHVSHIFEDMEGNLWFSTVGEGIYMLSLNTISISQRNTDIIRQLFPENLRFLDRIVSMESDSENRLWLANAEGKIEIITRKADDLRKTQSLDLAPYWQKKSELIHLLALQDNKMLIASKEELGIWENDSYTRLYGIQTPTSINRSASGQIIIGTLGLYSYLLSEKDLMSLKSLKDAERAMTNWESEGKQVFGVPSDIIYKDQYGDLWTAYSRGLSRDTLSGKRDFGDEEIFKARIEDMADSRDGLLWIATNGSGLIVVKENVFHPINTDTKGMNSNVIHDILVDDELGNIWIGTNRGVGKISRYDFEENYFPIQWFTDKEGLVANDVRALFKYEGDIYVATGNGLTLFDEKKIQEDNFLPKIYITAVHAEGKTLSLKGNYDFPADTNTIEIHFTGISYRNLGRLKFLYKLEEVDSDWKTTTKPFIRYSSLEAGSYTFLVKAASSDGPISPKPAKLVFEIAPVFYKTGWFIGLVLLAISLLIYGLLRYIYSEKQRMELEIRVDQKTFQLNQKVEELRRTNKDLEQFAYVASHDLKTPLRTVIGHLQLLERKFKGKLDPDAEDHMIFAVEGSKKMYGMINDLLAYARVGREKIDFDLVDLNRVLATVQHSLGSIIQEKNAIISYDNLPIIHGVTTLWEQLFQNLIQNGLKFNHSEIPEIRIEYKDSPEFWILSITDNGIGIEEEYQARIFELFQRLHTTEFPGTGIGLAVCKRIVELHGGGIWVESEQGRGTTFFFTIEKSGN